MSFFFSGSLFFILGALIYPTLEILFRGYTHWSMAIVGGLCFVLLAFISRFLSSWPLVLQCLLGAAGITAVEFFSGWLVNVKFEMAVWNYSNMPLQFMGQICLPYSLLWFALCFPGLWLAKSLSQLLQQFAA